MHYVSFSPTRERLLSKTALASGRRIGYFLAGVGLLCFGWGAWLFTQERIFLAHARRSTARIVELQERRSRVSHWYAPVFGYRDSTGREWRIASNETVGRGGANPGRTVNVFYSLDEPGKGQFEDFYTRWGVALILGLPGVVLALVGYVGTGVFEWLERTTDLP